MIEIHTLKWSGDQATPQGEEGSSTLFCRVWVDGEEVQNLLRAETRHTGTDFGEVILALHGPAVIIHHDQESWDTLGA